MATPTTLTPQPRAETRKNPIFGAIGDYFGEVMENVTGIIPVNEGPVRPQEILDPERGWSSMRPVESRHPIGGRTEINFNDRNKIQYEQTIRSIHELPQKVIQIEQIHSAEQEVRLEIAGLSDEQFADKAGYKNTSFRGPFLRTLHNMWDVFKTLMGEKTAALNDKKSLVVERARGKINHAVNKNSAAERGGGHTSVFDTPG